MERYRSMDEFEKKSSNPWLFRLLFERWTLPWGATIRKCAIFLAKQHTHMHTTWKFDFDRIWFVHIENKFILWFYPVCILLPERKKSTLQYRIIKLSTCNRLLSKYICSNRLSYRYHTERVDSYSVTKASHYINAEIVKLRINSKDLQMKEEGMKWNETKRIYANAILETTIIYGKVWLVLFLISCSFSSLEMTHGLSNAMVVLGYRCHRFQTCDTSMA